MGAVSVEAGCHFPLGREALIVSFPGSWPVNPARLPEGKGFDVVLHRRSDRLRREDGHRARATAGRVSGHLRHHGQLMSLTNAGSRSRNASRDVMDAFLERVREWQAFMARTHRPLSPDAQIGLLGELWMLRLLARYFPGRRCSRTAGRDRCGRHRTSTFVVVRSR